MFGPDFWQAAIIGFPVIVFSLTVHEYFHAWTALKFGDPTARDLGRLTLNPLAHLDMMGVLVMIISQFRFGWAKPVPVNPFNLRNPKVADIWISAAGPLSNIGLAIIAAILFRVLYPSLGGQSSIIAFLMFAVNINIVLAMFNMIPLFPLDGSHILRNLLPDHMQASIDQFDRFAPFLLLIMLVTGMLWIIIGPPVMFLQSLLLGF